MANKKKAQPKKEPKTITSKSVTKAPVFDDKGLQEIELLKDYGFSKKGDKMFKHPNTAQLLIDRKIAK